MKVYRVKVSNDKDHFFKELMQNLGIELEEFTAASYARITESREVSSSNKMNEEERKKAAKVREESLKDVISKIEQMRNKK